MSIPYIPVKLVEIIIQFAVEDNPRETHFTRQRDLVAFSLVSKTWLSISALLLLQHPTFSSFDSLEKFFGLCGRHRRIWPNVQSFAFRPGRSRSRGSNHSNDCESLWTEFYFYPFTLRVSLASFCYANTIQGKCLVLFALAGPRFQA